VAKKAYKYIITHDGAGRIWNVMSENKRRNILALIKNKVHSKDQTLYFYRYGNLYPKTQRAIRRYFDSCVRKKRSIF